MQSRYLDCMHADAASNNSTGGNVRAPEEPMAYTVKNAAKAFDLSERYMWELVLKGTIESIKIGRARRITRAAMEAYLENLRGAA